MQNKNNESTNGREETTATRAADRQEGSRKVALSQRTYIAVAHYLLTCVHPSPPRKSVFSKSFTGEDS